MAAPEGSLGVLVESWEEPSWRRLGWSWSHLGSALGGQMGGHRVVQEDPKLRGLELNMAKPQNLNTVWRISMIWAVQRPLLGAKNAAKSDLGAFGSMFEPS